MKAFADMPLSQLLETCRTFAAEESSAFDQPAMRRTMLVLNAELMRRVLHSQRVIAEMAVEIDAFTERITPERMTR